MGKYRVTKPYAPEKIYKSFAGARNALIREATKQRDRARVLRQEDLTGGWDRVIEWLTGMDEDGGKVRVPMPTIGDDRVTYMVKIERVDEETGSR